MKRILMALVTTVLISCSSSTKQSTEASKITKESVTPLAGSFQVHRYEFKNGLKLLVVEDHTSPTFAYHTWFRVGSRDEEPGKTGLAHLFEHMMFKQTKNLKEGEFDRTLERSGVEGLNAFTSRDYTGYIQELPKGNLELIAKLEADRMVNLVINDHAFKTEREVVQNERRFRNENSPDGLMDQELFDTAFRVHSYHWPVIGYQSDLNKMTAEDARKFYRSYYSPNHATIVVVGDVDPDQVREIVEKYYGHMVAQPPLVQSIKPEPPQKNPRLKKLKLNIQIEKLMMAYHIPPVTSEDPAVLEVMQSILTGGKSSRLHRALVDKGIAISVESGNYDAKDPSLYVIMVNLQRKQSAAKAESIILSEMNRLLKEPISEDVIQKAKNRINFAFYQSLDSNYEKCYFFGFYETVANDFTDGIRHFKDTQKATVEDVKRVVKRYLNPKNRTVIMGVPKQ